MQEIINWKNKNMLGKPYKYYQSDTVVCLTLNQDYENKS